MKKLQILLLSLLAFSLIACSTEEEKNILQAAFDNSNPGGNSAICISSGGAPAVRISFKDPYETYNITPGVDDYDYLVKVNNWRNNRLAIFAELGLLNQQALPNDQYRYTPTEMGLRYIDDDDDKLFCFGRIVLSDFKYEKKQDGMKLYSYDYYLENVPDWAKDPHLDKINSAIGKLALSTESEPWGGGMVFFTSDKQIARGQGVGGRVF